MDKATQRNKVYIVVGESGEYEYRTWWFVKAFFSKIEADKLVSNANRRFLDLHTEYGDRPIPDGANEFDIKMQQFWSDPVIYQQMEVPLQP